MARYDASFRPPAPVADIILIHPVTKISTAQLMGKIDSGAGITNFCVVKAPALKRGDETLHFVQG